LVSPLGPRCLSIVPPPTFLRFFFFFFGWPTCINRGPCFFLRAAISSAVFLARVQAILDVLGLFRFCAHSFRCLFFSSGFCLLLVRVGPQLSFFWCRARPQPKEVSPAEPLHVSPLPFFTTCGSRRSSDATELAALFFFFPGRQEFAGEPRSPGLFFFSA